MPGKTCTTGSCPIKKSKPKKTVPKKPSVKKTSSSKTKKTKSSSKKMQCDGDSSMSSDTFSESCSSCSCSCSSCCGESDSSFTSLSSSDCAPLPHRAVSKTNVIGSHQPTNTISSVNKNCTSTSPTEETNSELLTKSHPVKYKEASSLLSPISMPAALSYTSGEEGSLTRRSSSGGLLSPEVVGPPTEHDGFYLLKKDSQRRMTLSQDLSQDQDSAEICKGDAVLKMDLLETLMNAFERQNKDQLKTAIHSIKEYHEVAFLTVNKLCLVLDLFKSMVTLGSIMKQALEKLKLHLGALEQLLVQKRLLLSLVNHISQNSDGDSTENHRMMQELLKRHKVYQSMLKKALEDYKIHLGTLRQWEDQMGLLSSVVNHISQISDGDSTENHRIMQELLKKQKVYLSMLRKALEDYKIHLGTPRQWEDQMELLSSVVNHISRNSDGDFSEGDMTSPESEANNHNHMTPRISVTDSSVEQRLVDWLQTLRQDDTAISKFLAEE